MIRLFVAIELPADLRRRMASLGVGIGRARWVAEDNLHLTLRFIGEVQDDHLDDIATALGQVRFRPFPVTVRGAGHFGSGRRVRSLWLGVEKSAELAALRDRVESALVRIGIAPEGRKFHPHVTVARLNNGAPHEVRGWLAANTMFAAVPFAVPRLVLYSSFLGSAGAIHTAEATFPLGGD